MPPPPPLPQSGCTIQHPPSIHLLRHTVFAMAESWLAFEKIKRINGKLKCFGFPLPLSLSPSCRTVVGHFKQCRRDTGTHIRRCCCLEWKEQARTHPGRRPPAFGAKRTPARPHARLLHPRAANARTQARSRSSSSSAISCSTNSCPPSLSSILSLSLSHLPSVVVMILSVVSQRSGRGQHVSFRAPKGHYHPER